MPPIKIEAPATFAEAMNSEYSKELLKAVELELESIVANRVAVENGKKKGQCGVEVTVKSSTTRATYPPAEFISDRLMKVILELRGLAKTVTFVVAHDQLKHRMLLTNTHCGRPWTYSCNGVTQTRTAIRVDGCQRPDG